MKKILLSIMFMAALGVPSMNADSYYGFAPKECSETEMTALGSGTNAFMEAAIRIDPALDPLIANLKGRKITGVRCYLRADYKQKNKGFSCVKIYKNGLDSRADSKTVNFLAGWNEVYFDEPVEIGETPLYVGYQVFETQGEPYPLAAYKNAKISESCYINPARNGWEDYGSRGVLMIEAIVDGDASGCDGYVIASPFDTPLVVAPDSDFECSLYVHNQGSTPISSISYSGYDAAGNVTGTSTAEFTEPLPGYGSAVVRARLHTPSEEGSSVPLAVRAVEIDGNPVKGSMMSNVNLYISADVFHRVPLIEEFTGLMCNNCPFMFYYLDMALEQFKWPHVYVAHHAGFTPDVLTKPCDNALLYLFGPSGTYNPAVMYDRRIMQGCAVPVIKAVSEPDTRQYDTRLSEAIMYPALAKVLVDSDVKTDEATCRVYGKISKAALDFKDDLYVTAYLLEDNISTSVYPQLGLDPIPEGAPEDLLERFRHRGVIRHYFNTGDNGDKLTIDSYGNFEIEFPAVKMDSRWSAGNCEVVALVHKVNTDNLADNYVLNAGAARFNEYAETGVSVDVVEQDNIAIIVTPDGRILTSEQDVDLQVYSLTGCRYDADTALGSGVYVVRYQKSDGTVGVRKVMVK